MSEACRLKSVVPLLTKAIKTIDLNKSEIKSRVLNSPWKRIPNVKNFSISLGPQDALFEMYGIDKKVKPTLTIEPYKNDSMNRYVEHQVIRLSKARNNPKLYWQIAKILMKRSNTFRVLAINHVFPKWHREMPLHLILSLNAKVSKLINSDDTNLEFDRVYISKEKGGLRPLGVPKLHWRLYLHMISNFLTFYLEGKLKNQHAFMPGRGTLTAWKQIFIEKLYKMKYIYEWDFKSYFEQVNLSYLQMKMEEMKIPEEWIWRLRTINESYVELPEKVEMKEMWGAVNKHVPYNSMWNKDSESVYNAFWLMRNDIHGRMFWAKPWGLAQGAPTSPILANLIMDDWIKSMESKGHTCLAYADDSVTFSNIKIEKIGAKTHPLVRYTPETEWSWPKPVYSGIVINEKKSGLVKENGKWKGVLKFLGLKFNGKTFQAQTRKGSELKFSKWMRELINLDFLRIEQGLKLGELPKVIDINLEDKGSSSWTDSWDNYFKSRLIGFVQSRMYSGNWNIDNLEQDFSLHLTKKSWGNHEKFRQEGFTIFNISSYASLSLCNILRWKSKIRKPRRALRLKGLKIRFIG